MEVTVKSREQKGTIEDTYCSWAEQMLLDKLSKYRRKTFHRTFEVVKESEKAFQIRVTGIFKFTFDDTIDCEDWNVWMPKSAFIGY